MRSPRSTPVVLAALTALIVAACGSGTPDSTIDELDVEVSDADGTTATADADADADADENGGDATIDDLDVAVSGSDNAREVEFIWGGEPLAEWDEPFVASASETRIISGAGEAAGDTEGGSDQGADSTDSPTDAPDSGPDRMRIDYALANGTTGETVVSTFDSAPVAIDVGPGSQLPPGLIQALEGAQPGTALLTALTPQDGFGPNGNQALGITPEDSIILYVEVHDVYNILDAAEGTEVEPQDGLPTVEADGETAAVVTVPDGEEPPEELVVQLLVEGEGEETQPGQTVTVHYTGVSWDSGETFDDSWSRGTPFPVENLGSSPVIEGWNEGLQGLPVGSRVMLVIPPEQAYGELEEPEDSGEEDAETAAPGQGQHELAGQTLIFVVDILDAG